MPVVRVSSEYVDGDRRVEAAWTVAELASKLESVTGIPPDAQRLEFASDAGAPAHEPARSATLGTLGVTDGWRIRVHDTRPAAERLDLADAPAKPGMSYDEYAQREGTLLQWKREHGLGRFGATRPAAPAAPADFGVLTVPLGSECFVRLTSGKTVRGTVAFHGSVAALPSGPWVGVRLVSAEGLNDGSVKGVRLFDAEPNHGIVVRASAVRPLDTDEEEL